MTQRLDYSVMFVRGTSTADPSQIPKSLRAFDIELLRKLIRRRRRR